jgi:hypothetical protein
MYSLIQLKSGGQPGNQNARTHGFYSKVLTPDEKRALKRAAGVDGLDQEIAVLRVKIRTLLKNEGQNYRLIGQAFETLARVNNIKFGFSKNDGGKLKEAFRSTYGEYIFPQPSEAPAPNDSKPAVAPSPNDSKPAVATVPNESKPAVATVPNESKPAVAAASPP